MSKRPLPFLDLGAQYAGIKQEIADALQGVLDSRQFALGSAVARFEQEFAAYCETKHCAGVSSGTSALHLSLLAFDVGPGDEVITVPMTFIATVAAIGYTGATPVFVDVEPRRYTMDPRKLEAAITEDTKAIVPVHLYGQTADMTPILEIARHHDIPVIEDAAQAHGARYRGRRAGSLADAAAFSFYPGKNLGAYGEAGAVVTDRQEVIEKVKLLRDWGARDKYHHVVKGYNYRMDGFQGAVLGVKLAYLDAWNERRREVAARYDAGLADTPLTLPLAAKDAEHVYHLYAARSKSRTDLRGALQKLGVATGLHYPVPVHLQPCWKELGHSKGDFPVSEAVAAEELSLPIYAEMDDAGVDRVVEAIKQSV